ncbi:MAG: hypothetical protein ABI200_01955, partial [Gaiellales bacterium]
GTERGQGNLVETNPPPRGIVINALSDETTVSEGMSSGDYEAIAKILPDRSNEKAVVASGGISRQQLGSQAHGRTLIISDGWRISAVPLEADRHKAVCVAVSQRAGAQMTGCFHQFGDAHLQYTVGTSDGDANAIGIVDGDVDRVTVTTTLGRKFDAQVKNGAFMWVGTVATEGTARRLEATLNDGTVVSEEIPEFNRP